MFRVAAFDAYNSNGDQTDKPNGPRSVEVCLFRAAHRDTRCVRHSLGYSIPYTLYGYRWESTRLLLISRRVSMHIINRDMEECKSLGTPGLVTMCQQILEVVSLEYTHSMENCTVSVDGSIHWDVVNSFPGKERQERQHIEAFSLDIKIELYHTTRDIAQFLAAKSFGTHAPLEVYNQDIFEATYRIPASVAENNTSWKEWGFSEDDIDNFKTFLFGGTAFNNGTLLVTPPSLLADVSNIVVGLLFGVCLFMVVLALILSRGVSAMVRDPISEVLPEIKASPKRWDSSSSSSNGPDTGTSAISTSFLKRRVANLTLEHQALPDIESDSKNTSTTSLMPSKSPPRRGRLVLRMEIDGDDEDESIELLETAKNRD